MSLQTKIDEYKAGFRSKVPEDIQAVMAKATKDLESSNIVAEALKVGDTLPSFSLSNHEGGEVSLSSLLNKGPIVITFYRGGWCPYCNLELQAYQLILGDIHSAGASLVAITPELPDASLSTAEANELEFEVLSDVRAEYARSIGLVFSLPEELRPIYNSFGIHLEKHNGTGQFDLPLAATYIVNQDGLIVFANVSADYTIRQEPSELLSELRALKKA